MTRSRQDHNHRDRHYSGERKRRWWHRARRRRLNQGQRQTNTTDDKHRHSILWDRW